MDFALLQSYDINNIEAKWYSSMVNSQAIWSD